MAASDIKFYDSYESVSGRSIHDRAKKVDAPLTFNEKVEAYRQTVERMRDNVREASLSQSLWMEDFNRRYKL